MDSPELSTSGVSIRLAIANDAAAIACIYNEAIRTTTATFDIEPKSDEDRVRWLAAHDERHPVFVAEVDGQVAGWAALTQWSDRPAYNQTAETTCYVAEPFRGRGIGRALKGKLIEEARRLGFHTLLSRAANESVASIHINETLGFQHIGTMKEVGFKFGRRLDVHTLQLMLNDADSSEDSPTGNAVVGGSSARRPDDIGSIVLESAIASFRANKELADKAIAQLPDDRLRVALDENTNSIAVIMKHVAGNLLSRWTDFLTTDGEKASRNRDDEFVDSFAGRDEVLARWERGWDCLFAALAALEAEDLSKTITIRGEPLAVPYAIDRSLAHCGYHVGQIVLIARILGGDHWKTITIPRGESGIYNQAVWGKGR